MVVIVNTMPSDQNAFTQDVVLKRMKEFKSLENDICYLKATSIDGYKNTFHDESIVLNRNDFSSSLPNLTSTIILFDENGLGHVDLKLRDGNCVTETNPVTKTEHSRISDNCTNGLNAHNYSRRPLSSSQDINDGSNVITPADQKTCLNGVHNGDTQSPSDKSYRHAPGNLSQNNNFLHDSMCYKDSGSLSELPNCHKISPTEDSNVSDSVEHTQLLKIPPDQINNCNHTGDDIDSEQTDELTRLKYSPRSSPGNTLDSITSSLCRTDSFGKTDGSSYSSVSSLSADIPSTSTNFTKIQPDTEENFPAKIPDTHDSDSKREDNWNEFVEVSLKNQNTFEKCTSSQDSGIDIQSVPPIGTKARKKGVTLAAFLSRNLFSRKTSKADDNPQEQISPPGWKLFGKVPPKDTPQREPTQISQQYQARKDSLNSTGGLPDLSSSSSSSTTHSPGTKSSTTTPSPETKSSPSPGTASTIPSPVICSGGGGAKKCDIEVLSTTALILEHRPMGLPSKDPEEELKHRLMYEQMVEAAKKKEQKEMKQRKKQLEQQLKYEDCLTAALKVWNTDILPHWQTMQFNRRALDLWWRGIPPSIRGKVWKLAFGNDLNLTKDLYHICVNRAKERLKLIEDWCGDTDSVCSHMSGFSDHSASREASVELIKLDVSRTFPQLCIFQKGGPYHELLQGLLGAYACYRPDVGYVQGMSFIAAVLLLNMEVHDAFICFANLLNRPCQIAFFRLDESLMKSYFDTYEEFFEENLPKLFHHFQKLNITPDLYIIDWMFTLYAKSLPLDVASRVWDVFGRDGEEFLFRTALGILRLYEDILINLDFIHLAQFLTRLPEDIQSDELFRCIDRIKMCIETRRFKEVLASNRDPQSREM